MELKEVQSQSWHTLVTGFYICQSCSYVYRAPILLVSGTPCQNCGKPLPAQRMHFGLSSYSLVNSIQDFYFLRRAKLSSNEHDIVDYIHTNDTDTRIVLPILYCTLWDGLTTDLCQNIMRSKGLEASLRDRLLHDYRFAREKREKLLPALTGEKWNYALTELTRTSQIDYTKHFELFLSINSKRNTYVHEGSHWHFKDDELENIPEDLWPTFSLFAALHNRYVPSKS